MTTMQIRLSSPSSPTCSLRTPASSKWIKNINLNPTKIEKTCPAWKEIVMEFLMLYKISNGKSRTRKELATSSPAKYSKPNSPPG